MSAKLSQWDLDHFESHLIGGHAHHFSAILIRLLRKADVENRLKLQSIYPDHVAAMDMFDAAPFGSRMWRCMECQSINARARTLPAPGMCRCCGNRGEPPPLPEQKAGILRFWFYGIAPLPVQDGATAAAPDPVWGWREIGRGGFGDSMQSLATWEQRGDMPVEFNGCALALSVGPLPGLEGR